MLVLPRSIPTKILYQKLIEKNMKKLYVYQLLQAISKSQ